MAPEDRSTRTLEEWAGSQHLNLTLVFTDIVDSTAIGVKLGDRTWIEDLFRHFSHARFLVVFYDCFVVKVIGDSLMVAFRTSTDAVDFAVAFAKDTGVNYIGIRAGINSGQVQIKENDIYGLNVNFTSRVQHSLSQEGILVSSSVKRDYEKTFGSSSDLRFVPQEVELKSFGKETLWEVDTLAWLEAVDSQRAARQLLLGGGRRVRFSF
ncbi:MAG TPA: adenylate/guanylate cyclase domain-containing protein [Pyrinomonadaceae bacterium]|jgi:class 3 adenylate cyclase